MPKINHRLISVFLFLKKSQISAFFCSPISPKTNGGLILTFMPINNSIAECGVRACTYYTGGVAGPTTPSNCAITQSANGGIEIRTIEKCYGPTDDITGKPTDAYRECESCTWGFEKQIAGSYTANCGLLEYNECLPVTGMSTTKCYDEGPVETFTNQNGCASGERRYLLTDTHGLLGPIEDCTGSCQANHEKKWVTVNVTGCNSSFQVEQCEFTCNRAADCPDYDRNYILGKPVAGKDGLLQQVTCTNGKCGYRYRCDTDEGYYNSNNDADTQPTSCSKCPQFQGNYGEYGSDIKCKSNNPTLSGCYIQYNREITVREGTFYFTDQCFY